MARGKQTSEEAKAKVIELKMQNLELSSRDIAKQLEGTEWEVSNDTVCDIINNLPQLATASIEGTLQITRLDSIIGGIEDITSKMIARIANKEDITINEVKQLNEIAKTNWERKRLLQGESTSNVNLLGDVLSEIQGLKNNS